MKNILLLIDAKNKHVSELLIKIGFVIFVISLPVSHVPVQFSIIIIFTGWLLDGILNKNWHYRFHYFFVPLMFYIVWKFIASAFSARPLHSLWALADNEWPMIIMVMMYWLVRNKKMLRILLVILLLTASIVCFYAIIQTVSGFEFHKRDGLAPMGRLYRAVGFYNFYLSFALLAMFVLLMSISLIFEHVRILGKYSFVVPALAFLAIIGSFARSIWLSVFVALLFLVFWKKKKRGAIIILLIIAFMFVVSLISVEIQQRILSTFNLSQNTTRINLWKTSINIIKENPILGIGEDNFDYVFDRYQVQGIYDTKAHPHNDFLNVLVNSGFPGLIAFVTIWIITLNVGFKTWKRSKDLLLRGISLGATITIIGFLIAGLFQNYYGTFVNCWLWWFTTGLIFVSNALMKDYNVSETDSSIAKVV